MRLPNWQGRLLACLAGAEARPFAWGVHDCCLFAADCVAAVTGCDPLADWRGRYHTERSAWRFVRKFGDGLEAAVESTAARQGWPVVAVAQAQRGDVALAVIDGWPTIVVCVGAVFAGPSSTGWVRVPPSVVTKVWRVG